MNQALRELSVLDSIPVLLFNIEFGTWLKVMFATGWSKTKDSLVSQILLGWLEVSLGQVELDLVKWVYLVVAVVVIVMIGIMMVVMMRSSRSMVMAIMMVLVSMGSASEWSHKPLASDSLMDDFAQHYYLVLHC